MALTIAVIDENGNVETQTTDVGNVLLGLVPDPKDTSYRCLPFIDPYGDTVFNILQAPVLIDELVNLRAKARTEEEREIIDIVLRFARQVADGVHLYIKFNGD